MCWVGRRKNQPKIIPWQCSEFTKWKVGKLYLKNPKWKVGNMSHKNKNKTYFNSKLMAIHSRCHNKSQKNCLVRFFNISWKLWQKFTLTLRPVVLKGLKADPLCSKGLTRDGSKWRLGIDSTLAGHFLANTYLQSFWCQKIIIWSQTTSTCPLPK